MANKKPKEYIIPKEKMCSRCFNVKKIDQFHKMPHSLDNHHHWCKACYNEYRRTEWYPKHREKLNEASKKWRRENPEKVKEMYEKNKGKIKLYQVRYRQKNQLSRMEHQEKWNKGEYEEPTELDCRGCGQTLPVSDFYKNRSTPRGYNLRCRDCIREYNKRRAQNA